MYRERKRQHSNAQKKTVEVSHMEQSDVISSTVSDEHVQAAVQSVNSNERQTRSSVSPMLVKINFPSKKRRSNALRKANTTILQMRSKIAALRRSEQKWKKRSQRVKSTARAEQQRTSVTNNLQIEAENTPSTRARNELYQSGISPSQIPQKVIRKLTMANAILNEIKSSRQSNPKQNTMNVLSTVICGKVVKKYRMVSKMNKATGISKKYLNKSGSKVIQLKGRARLTVLREQMKRQVISFLERDDISVCMPGKNDHKKHDGEIRQTRVLNDYLANIFEKFKAEYTENKTSFSAFCKMRPRYILLTSFISRNTCLCSKHQNMAMKLKCLRSIGLHVPSSPESLSRTMSEEDVAAQLAEITEEEIEFEQWGRVEIDGKKRMKVLKIKKQKKDFVTIMKQELNEFLCHVSRVKAQYSALNELKNTLPKDHVIVQMDFAENFLCSNMDEIQSAYWNSTNVTLHPAVVYYKEESENALRHKNYVYLSDVNQHNSTAVLTILKKLVPEIKEAIPDTKYIHYWTDSPSSQYRNRYIFDALLKHHSLYDVTARWNYFESGHGKGPCDGLGGSAKRQAADAVKQGKVTIQDAHDFFKWAKASQKSINYRFYSASDMETTSAEIATSSAKAIPGTMKLHAVFPIGDVLHTRQTSCYCRGCLSGNDLCPKWIAHIAYHSPVENDQPGALPEASFVPEQGRFVAARYDENWFIGKVIAVDESDLDAKISFMEKTRGKGVTSTFKWPQRLDDLWVSFSDILCCIGDPIAVGKTKRQFTISATDMENILSCFGN